MDIRDREFSDLLLRYGIEVCEDNGEVFIEETNETISVDKVLEELLPSLLL